MVLVVLVDGSIGARIPQAEITATMALKLAQDVQTADAFKKTQQAERAEQAETLRVQEGVDCAREQNACRKMDKVGSWVWDLDKTRATRSGDGMDEEGGGAVEAD